MASGLCQLGYCLGCCGYAVGQFDNDAGKIRIVKCGVDEGSHVITAHVAVVDSQSRSHPAVAGLVPQQARRTINQSRSV